MIQLQKYKNTTFLIFNSFFIIYSHIYSSLQFFLSLPYNIVTHSTLITSIHSLIFSFSLIPIKHWFWSFFHISPIHPWFFVPSVGITLGEQFQGVLNNKKKVYETGLVQFYNSGVDHAGINFEFWRFQHALLLFYILFFSSFFYLSLLSNWHITDLDFCLAWNGFWNEKLRVTFEAVRVA